MRTILIITSKSKPVAPIAEAQQEWQKQRHLLIAESEEEAADILSNDDVDLLVCDFASRPQSPIRPLTRLILDFSWIPCITVIDPATNSTDDFLGNGVSICFEMPFQLNELYRWTDKLLEQTTKGEIRGVPAHSILQMLESEKKTCTLTLHGKESSGHIYIEHGEIVAAEIDGLHGEEAACSIIAGDNHTAEIRYYNMQREREIDKSPMSLIMEAFRIKDEKESLAAREESGGKPQMELKHFFTLDSPLRLNPGLQLKLEADGHQPLTAELVGSRDGKYIIVRICDLLEDLPITSETRFALRYLHSGCISMFKARVIQQISQPEQLLFIEYPMVVHYHELRQAKRANIYVPCIMALANGQRHSSTLKDLSATGCLCQIKESKDHHLPPIDNESGVALYCLFPGVGEEQEIEGIVRNVKHKDGELLVGIEFSDISAELQEIITSYLDSLVG